MVSAMQAGAGELKDVAAKAAPSLILPTLAGESVDLKALRGKVVLVNFWAVWCPPCRKEMPSMNRLAASLGGKPFIILGVNAGDEPAAIHAFMDKVPVEFPIVMDAEGVSLKAWRAFVFPTSYVVDKQGRLRMGLVGSIEWDAPETVARIEALLNEAD